MKTTDYIYISTTTVFFVLAVVFASLYFVLLSKPLQTPVVECPAPTPTLDEKIGVAVPYTAQHNQTGFTLHHLFWISDSNRTSTFVFVRANTDADGYTWFNASVSVTNTTDNLLVQPVVSIGVLPLSTVDGTYSVKFKGQYNYRIEVPVYGSTTPMYMSVFSSDATYMAGSLLSPVPVTVSSLSNIMIPYWKSDVSIPGTSTTVRKINLNIAQVV
jgi:hypothetical protein